MLTPVGNKQPVFIIEDDEKEVVTTISEQKTKPERNRTTPTLQKVDQHGKYFLCIVFFLVCWFSQSLYSLFVHNINSHIVLHQNHEQQKISSISDGGYVTLMQIDTALRRCFLWISLLSRLNHY